MKYDEKTSRVTLSSGRSFYAWGGDVYPQYAFGNWQLMYGSDGSVSEHDDLNNLTPDERNEIASYFISLWNSWRDDVPPESEAAVIDLAAIRARDNRDMAMLQVPVFVTARIAELILDRNALLVEIDRNARCGVPPWIEVRHDDVTQTTDYVCRECRRLLGIVPIWNTMRFEAGCPFNCKGTR